MNTCALQCICCQHCWCTCCRSLMHQAAVVTARGCGDNHSTTHPTLLLKGSCSCSADAWMYLCNLLPRVFCCDRKFCSWSALAYMLNPTCCVSSVYEHQTWQDYNAKISAAKHWACRQADINQKRHVECAISEVHARRKLTCQACCRGDPRQQLHGGAREQNHQQTQWQYNLGSGS